MPSQVEVYLNVAIFASGMIIPTGHQATPARSDIWSRKVLANRRPGSHISSSVATISRDCHLLQLPLKLRERIYSEVLSPKYAKSPKDADGGLRASMKFQWNINPAVLRLNRQISSEASTVMARENNFVVIERSQDLEQREADMVDDDPAIMQYKVILWPGKKTKIAKVPGERMRLRFAREQNALTMPETGPDVYVLLVEEFRDFCVALSIFQGQNRQYRTSGLSVHIRLIESEHHETPQAQDYMRTSLLKPLTKLRHFKDVKAAGMAPFVEQMILGDLKQTDFEGGFVISTIQELIHSGDCARDEGLYSIIFPGTDAAPLRNTRVIRLR